MKNLLAVLLIACLLVAQNLSSQVSFSIAPYTCQNSTLDLAVQSTVGLTNYTWSAQPNTAVFTSANAFSTAIVFGSMGNYTITLNTNAGSTTQSIAIVAPLNFTAIQSSATTCITSNFPKFSKPVKITTSGATTCTWNPVLPMPITNPVGNPQLQVDVRPASSTCWTITGFFGFCNATTAVCVSVTPQFTIEVLGNFEYCEPNPATASVTNIGSSALAPFTYSWTESAATLNSIDNNLLHYVNLRPAQAASYTVEVKDDNKCVSVPKVIAVNKTSCVSILEASANDVVGLIYDRLQQNLHLATDTEVDLCVFSGDGKLFLKKTSQTNFTQSTSQWPAGLYVVSLRSAKAAVVKKLIVE